MFGEDYSGLVKEPEEKMLVLKHSSVKFNWHCQVLF